MAPHWIRRLSVVILSLVSTSSFGVHTDYFFKSEAEARGASVWECGYVEAGLWYSLPGGAMSLEDCMSSAPENALKKVLEQGNAWVANAPPGYPRYCQPPPVRDDKCSKWPQPPMPDPVTGLPVNVYALRCYERQTLQCAQAGFGGVGIIGGVQMHAGVIGIKGHIDPFQSADVLILVDVPPPPPPPPPECPVDVLKDKPIDACSVALEAGNGLPVPDTACPTPSVMTDPRGEPCLRGKLAGLGIPYAGPTSTIRTAPYQAHLKDVYDRFWEHQWLDPVPYNACTAKRAIVEAEMNKHGIDYAPIGTSHNDGKAFDISRGTVGTLKRVLRQAGRNVSGLLREPPACNLGWGGTWPSPDEVHFFTP